MEMFLRVLVSNMILKDEQDGIILIIINNGLHKHKLEVTACCNGMYMSFVNRKFEFQCIFTKLYVMHCKHDWIKKLVNI